MKENVRVLYEDNSFREMIDIYVPFGSINLYIDHFDIEELETKNYEAEHGNDWSEDSENDDLDFVDESDKEESNNENLDFITNNIDVELLENVKIWQLKKVSEVKKNIPPPKNAIENNKDDYMRESDNLSDELRSLCFSSKDESHMLSYIGPPPVKKTKKKEFSLQS